MKIVLLHNHYDEKHLIKVIAEMKTLGAPTIKAYDLGFDDLVQAIEGCHRLRACETLGIEPVIEWIDDTTLIGDVDIDTDADPEESVAILGDWVNYAITIED